jgi:hypothetical protein
MKDGERERTVRGTETQEGVRDRGGGVKGIMSKKERNSNLPQSFQMRTLRFYIHIPGAFEYFKKPGGCFMYRQV